VSSVPVRLEVDGRLIDTRPVTIDPSASGSVTFPPFTVSESSMRGTLRAGTDAMPKDNAFHFALSPSRPISVLVVQADGADASPSLFLTTALSVGTAPAFKVDVVPVSRVTPSTLERRMIIVLNDATSIPSTIDDLLKRYVEQGGGLWIALGEHAPWASGTSALLPGRLGAPVDRTVGRGGRLGFLDYSHPIFELFKQPHSGDFTVAPFARYRSLDVDPADHVLARFDDGAAALVERRLGSGRIVAFTSTLGDEWNDFGKTAVFVPFVLQVARYLSHYDEPNAWYAVGRLLDVSTPLEAVVREGGAADPKAQVRKPSGVVLTPSGQQLTIGEGGTPSIELGEQGFYTVRMQGTAERRPFAVAVNLDPAESDLTPLEPREFVATATGRAAVTATGQSLEHPALTPEDLEKKQTVWWFLLVGGVLALLTEAVLSNRLSRRFGVGLLQTAKR
jgi:hypothetical protein